METLFREHVQINTECPLLSPKLLKTLDAYIVARNSNSVIPVASDNNEIDDINSFKARLSEDCNTTIQQEWYKLVNQFEAICYKAIAHTCDNLAKIIK